MSTKRYYLRCGTCDNYLIITGGFNHLDTEDVDGELEDFLLRHTEDNACYLSFNPVTE